MTVWTVSFAKRISTDYYTYEIMKVFHHKHDAEGYAKEVAPELEDYYGNVEIDIEEFEVD